MRDHVVGDDATGVRKDVPSAAGATDDAVGPRESMRRLPGWLQHPLTLFTGKALAGQVAPRWWTPSYHLCMGLLNLTAGLLIGVLGWSWGGAGLFLLVPGWMVTLHALRNLRMLIFHQCSHRNMYRKPRLDALIGELLASLLLVQNFRRYQREHVSDHHGVHHMTLRDPTVQAFLLSLDVHPGMSRRRMWRRVLRKVTSPIFHARFAVARLQSFWIGATVRERVSATVIHGGATAVAAVTGDLPGLLLVWFLPLFLFFQVANVLRLCVKHTFPAPGTEVKKGKAYFGSLTSAVFIGEAVPAPGAPWWVATWRWARWVLRMLVVHAPIRYMVITADTPVHDYHHRHPAVSNWAHHLYARQADLDAGSPGWPAYTELWGLAPAMNHIFESLARADPTEFDVARIRDVSKRELFAAFDD